MKNSFPLALNSEAVWIFCLVKAGEPDDDDGQDEEGGNVVSSHDSWPSSAVFR